jgi:ABC-type sugar transport system substrate-binding protein
MSRTRSLRIAITAVAIAAALLAASACGSNSTGKTGTSADGASGKTVALVGYGNASPWGAYFNEIYNKDAGDAGVKITDMTTMDPGSQVQKFNQAIAQKPDLIVALLWDTKATVVPIEKAKQAGIPVVVVDGRPDPAVAADVMSVLSDNVKLGEFAAQNIVEGLKAQNRASGNVLVISGTKAMLVTQDRMKGFNKVMAENPQFKVVADEDTNWDPALSGRTAQQLLAKFGKNGVQAAYGMADYMALPIVQAAKQAGFKVGGKDGLVITGGNCFKAGIQAIKAGELYGTATEDPGTIAKQTADYTVQFLSGKNPPKSVLVTEQRVTQETLGQYGEQCSHA